MKNEVMSSPFYEKRADDKDYLFFKKYNITTEKPVCFPHFHNSMEIVFVTKGKCAVCVNGVENIAHSGDFVVIDCFDVHYYKYFFGSELYVFLISEKYLDENNGLDKKCFETFLPKCKNYSQLMALFEHTYALWHNANNTYRSGLVDVLVGAMMAQYPLIERTNYKESKSLVDVLCYINENFTKDLTLEFLSKKFGYSKNYFSSLFNKTTGMNLRSYINQRRICEFELLKNNNPDITVSVAAQKCGFDNLKTFYRAYNNYNKTKS